jgi:formylmethanofuran dehydrogenase subunit B
VTEDIDDTEARTVNDVPCLACGCLCDDVGLTVRDGRIFDVRQACEVGVRWFLAPREPTEWPDATVDGQAAAQDTALGRATAILQGSRSPVVLGLSNSSCETQRAAVALGDRVGAVMALSHEEDARSRLAAYQRIGRVSASLGEVKSRADVIVFWGVDPAVTHPRHFERYSIAAKGRFAPEKRLVLVADERETETMKRADASLIVGRGEQLKVLRTLRRMTRGESGDEALQTWCNALSSAHYGAWFLGTQFGEDVFTPGELVEFMMLIRELNDRRRFVALPLGEAGNPAGAENVLAWQTGFPSNVSLGRGFPSFEPERGALADRFANGEFDAAVIVGDVEPPAGIERIPTIAIGPKATSSGAFWSVGMATATPGISGGGTVMRCDGVMLPLRPGIQSRWPDERQWLARIEEGLR